MELRLIRQHRSAEEEHNLHVVLDTDAPFIHIGDFSPGPWFGFDGIVTLALTETTLYVSRRSSFSDGFTKKQAIPVAELESVTFERMAQKIAVRGRVKVRGSRPRLFSSKYQEAEDLLRHLQSITDAQ